MHLMGWERLERRTRAVPFPAARDAPILCACRVIEPCWKPGHPHEGPLGRLWTPVFPRYLSPGAFSSARCQGSCKTPKCCLSCFCEKCLSHRCWNQYVPAKCFGDLGVFHQREGSAERLLEKSAWWSMTCCCKLPSEIQHYIVKQV